jgi:hypothetical protein
MVSAVLHFFVFVLVSYFFFYVEYFQSGFYVPSFFLGTIPCSCLSAPSFVFFHNMSQSDNGQTIAAAVTSQIKLCPYDEEELAMWFCLIGHQIAKTQVCQCFGQPAQESPSGHF